MIVDHKGSRDDANMRAHHERLVNETGKFSSTYSHFIEGLFFAPSHLSMGIQLADMVAGTVWRRFERQDMTYFNMVKSSFRTNASGQIDGYGIVRFPKIRANDVG